MNITVNDTPTTVKTRTLDTILTELGYGTARVATAVNGQFVPASQRNATPIHDGAVLEILAPMQGG